MDLVVLWKTERTIRKLRITQSRRYPNQCLFVANMQDSEIQKELLKETLDPDQTLSLAIKMELGQRNQFQISNSQPNPQVNPISQKRQFPNPNPVFN